MKKLYFFAVFILSPLFTNAQVISIPDAAFKTKLLNYSPPIDTNNDHEIQVSEALAVTQLHVNQSLIIDATGLAAFSNLTELSISHNNLAALDLSHLTNLQYADCSYNQLSSLNVSNLIHLTGLFCLNNNLTSLDISDLVLLQHAGFQNNQLTALDVSHNIYGSYWDLRNNLFTSLDFSPTVNISNSGSYILSNNPNLVYLNLKNGVNQLCDISVENCSNLTYVCTDEDGIQNALMQISFSVLTGVQVNSYCSFIPGGNYNTITGTVTLDTNNNGCDTNDLHFPNIKVGINDGMVSGAAFTNTDGNYSFYTQSGNFVLMPIFENPYFTITPASITVNFPELDNAAQTQNFCITPLGIHNDLEITLIGNPPAPGFDAQYQLTYKNKGNQTQSGNINLAFDDSILDFVVATPGLLSQSANNLSWAYADLRPFESRSINFTLNLNAPTEIPAVNINDLVSYTATITPALGDETPGDNVSSLLQTVVGSYDPNDKTCLEGNSIAPEKVGDYLHYVIRFQNSGTVAAQNIVVKDVIDATKFDVASLQLVGSSHSQTTKISGTKVEFVFENINLPAEINDEYGSHGFVAFKIKTKNNLVIGNTVENKADIYFDYNFPIETNTATTTVALLAKDTFENQSVSVYPNPVKDKLHITANGNITSIQLFDVQGRLISTSVENSSNVAFDLSKNSVGVYFVKVHTNNGVKVEKIIKQ
jgi:uncharacterized repeat protein (TIGR01451 family)